MHRAARRTWAHAALFSVIVLAACADTAPRTWIIRFAPGDAALERDATHEGVEADWERIGTRIVSGSLCGEIPGDELHIPGDGAAVNLTQTIARGMQPTSTMNTLPPGPYTVMAWAVDATEALYAWSCLQISSPGSGPIVSELHSVPSPRSLHVDWHVAFESPAAAAGASRVFLRRAPGTCPASPPATLVHDADDERADVPASGELTRAIVLTSAEPTMFLAWAESDATCGVVAYGCTDGPGPARIDTTLRAAAFPACADARACRVATEGLACDHVVVVEAAVGDASECFRTSAGEIFCDGSISGAPLPLPAGFVATRLVSRRVRRTTETPTHDRTDGYCALSADGRLACWGDAYPFLDTQASTPTLVDRASLPDASLVHVPIDVSLGLRFGCVVMGPDPTTGGAVWCRGVLDTAGDTAALGAALGVHDPVESTWMPSERAPAGAGSDTTQIATGAMHTCATNGSRIWCWGDPASANWLTYDTQQFFMLQDGTVHYRTLQLGELFGCADGDDDRFVCWGSDRAGQLAPRFTPPLGSSMPASCPSDWEGLLLDPACAPFALSDGSLYDQHATVAASSSYDGAVGHAIGPEVLPARCAALPHADGRHDTVCPVPMNGADFHVRAIAVGAYHVCAISHDETPLDLDDADGRVVCWGDDGIADQAGGIDTRQGYENTFTHGSAVWVNPCDDTGRGMPGTFLEDVVSIAAGSVRTCAVDARGDVWCWGGARRAFAEPTGCASRPASVPATR